MTFVNVSRPPSDPESSSPKTPPPRPKFHHQNTNDRIREGSQRPVSFHMISKIKKDRKSVFRELGLDSDDYPNYKEFGELTGLATPPTTPRIVRFVTERETESRFNTERETESDDGRSEIGNPSKSEPEREPETQHSPTSPTSQKWYSRLTPGRRPKIRTVASAPPPGMSSFSRISTVVLLIAVVLPAFSYYNGRETVSLNGADAGVIQQRPKGFGPVLETRADSPTQICKRWSQQTAQLNGTLYIYGGQAKTSAGQTSDTWNNDFLALDLTKSWNVQTPALRGLTQPSGPPAVANGYLWNDYNNLYLYGGLFSDTPYVEPAPESMWKYNIGSKQWTEYPSPQTSQGNHSGPGGVLVQRAAEGAGISVPELGLSWYFGGHLDLSTTPGWSNQIARVYLKSLLEFTHPGYLNDGMDALHTAGAGDGGAYRNITQGGLQTDAAFTERADGVLVFVPGWGEKGVLIGLGGGTADSFSESLSTLDVYDIANSEWFHQQTSGTPPSVRVNACAVIASAPDASSFNIYLYGGQNLQPYRQQIQYSDMYILSIPAFIWIKVDLSDGPPPRAGHTCNLRDGQIVVVGGYVNATTIPCESPGIYVFDASSLQWTNRFSALDHPPDLHPENSVLANSYGYKVPPEVASIIGGDADGHATATTPYAGPATAGPFATGKPPVFTVTAAGSTATVTQWGPGATSTLKPGSSSPNDPSSVEGGNDPRRAGLIAAGVIAGLAGLLAGYLGYCAWLYRRQVRAYRSHLALTNRYYNPSTSVNRLGGLAAAFFGGQRLHTSHGEGEGDPINEKRASSSRPVGGKVRYPSTSTIDSFLGGGGGGQAVPKQFLDDEPTPRESGYYSRGGSEATRPTWWIAGMPGGASGSGSGSGTTGSYLHSQSHTTGTGTGTGTSPGVGSGIGSGVSPPDVGGAGVGVGGVPRRSDSDESGESTAERLLDGQEPSFFSVVMGPRRALRVVNGLESENEAGDIGGRDSRERERERGGHDGF
ncbi:hypothetical protein QBC47DRAFT_446315 [Echria macrotheca]|uniref:Uncharacterized protein n=1 Tax=Echria macrotheca TaxID=438768 RepID=A0AAJ0BCP3_9PEZI|nr:hypothetical protein QBC47DRAFT_446315 [Echria macrotheca]